MTGEDMNDDEAKPSQWGARQKATNAAAQAIIDTEVAEREAKTERLKAAREAMESGAPIPLPAPKRAKTAKLRRARAF
jgi:hypothetical protein